MTIIVNVKKKKKLRLIKLKKVDITKVTLELNKHNLIHHEYFDKDLEAIMRFYNLKLKKTVEVDESEIEFVTMKNGRPAAKAEIVIDGEPHKVFKILSKDEAAKLKK